MRTMFVNPTRRRRKRAKVNPRPHRAPRRHKRRARRRNAGITPFVAASNPLIVPNPRRKSRVRRHNPLSSPKKLFEETLINVGGAGIGVAANYFAINKIDNVWARNGARAAAAIASGMFIPGRLGAASSGAMLYPAMMELVDYMLKDKGWGEKDADLDMLSADLEALLDVP
jgi:hypothetical protein